MNKGMNEYCLFLYHIMSFLHKKLQNKVKQAYSFQTRISPHSETIVSTLEVQRTEEFLP